MLTGIRDPNQSPALSRAGQGNLVSHIGGTTPRAQQGWSGQSGQVVLVAQFSLCFGICFLVVEYVTRGTHY